MAGLFHSLVPLIPLAATMDLALCAAVAPGIRDGINGWPLGFFDNIYVVKHCGYVTSMVHGRMNTLRAGCAGAGFPVRVC
jgi:hypothetical protein